MYLPPIVGVSYGLVVGRWIQIVGDTPADTDSLPDVVPVSGKITFVKSQKTATLPDTGQNDGTFVHVTKQAITGYLRTLDGELAVSTTAQEPGLWLPVGEYSVSFDFVGATWPSATIVVGANHVLGNPFDLVQTAL